MPCVSGEDFISKDNVARRLKELEESIPVVEYIPNPDFETLSQEDAARFIAGATYRDILLPKDGGVSGFEHASYPSLTSADIEIYERENSLNLPEDLKALLLHQNGGYLHDCALVEEFMINSVCSIAVDPTESSWGSTMIPVYQFLEARGDIEEDEDFIEAREELSRVFIISGDGHYFLCLDYRGSNTCRGIVHVDVEGGFNGITKVSDDFRSLFNYWD